MIFPALSQVVHLLDRTDTAVILLLAHSPHNIPVITDYEHY